MKLAIFNIAVITFALAVSLLGHAEQITSKKSLSVNLDKQTATLIHGTSELDDTNLEFQAVQKKDAVIVKLAIDEKAWVTHLSLAMEEFRVSAEGIVLSAKDKQLMNETVIALKDKLNESLRDYMHSILLAQVLGYWAASPDNYVIRSGTRR